MESIKEILAKNKFEDDSIKRFEIEYLESKNKTIWFEIAKEFIDKIDLGVHQKDIWNNLIHYVHGRLESSYELNKSICLIGQTGSGKTKTLDIMNKYIEVGNIFYQRKGKVIPFWFRTITANEISAKGHIEAFGRITGNVHVGYYVKEGTKIKTGYLSI